MYSHHIAFYSGGIVRMGYVAKKDQFRFACLRVKDNAGEGYVITPKGQVYRIEKSSRMAKLVGGGEAKLVLDSLAELVPVEEV